MIIHLNRNCVVAIGGIGHDIIVFRLICINRRILGVKRKTDEKI
jgi:hypothetical protein